MNSGQIGNVLFIICSAYFLVDSKKTKAEKTFTAEDTKGSVDIEFNFDGTKYAGKDVVVFEDLYFDGELVGQHADINDPEQTISLPSVATKVKDKETGKNVITHANKTITVVDNVTYTNLIVGEEYKVTGKLMDKSTGKVLVDKNGKEITAEKTFTAATENGSIDIEFTLDISNLADKQVVAFETLWLGEDIVGSHEDLNDEAQTLTIEKPEPAPKTGDEIPPYVYGGVVALMLAAGTGTTIFIRRKHNA